MTFVYFLIFLSAAAAAGATGALFQPGAWYDGLVKPGWTPPPWAFPVVWTTLYILMSWAAARVAGLPGAGLALAFWAVQIALNTLWTPVFFGLHRIGAALVVLGFLWLAVVATTIALWRMDRVAGAMLLPYVAWVSLAGLLNYTIWRLNPDAAAAAAASG